MDELGGAFIKLGQLLSLRYDLLPAEYCDEFSKLQDDVKPFPFKQIKAIVEKDLKKPLNKVFKNFNKDPVAAASIGQVHKAVLQDGTVVAVKVQRPKIKELFKSDLALLYYLAFELEKHFPEIKLYEPIEIVKEFEKYTKKELDYMLEAKNIDSFYNNFKDNDMVKIPQVYWDYTSPRVITMEYIEGKKLIDVKNFNTLKSSRKKVADVFINAMIKQVFDDGLFHADPHPGNIFMVGNNRIAFLDFGIVGMLSQDSIRQLENLMIGMAQPNINLIVKTILDMGFTDEEIDVKAFKSDLIDGLGPYYNAKVGQVNFTALFDTMFTIGRKYKLKMPLNMILLAKSFTTMEGLSKKYLPEFNYTTYVVPKAKEILKKRYSPNAILSNIKNSTVDFTEVLRNFPTDVTRLIRSLKKGTQVNVDMDNKDVKELTMEIDRSSNRLTFGMIIAALIIAASVIILAKVGPFYWGIPLLSYLCIILALIFSLALIVSIFKEKGGEI